MKLSVIIPCFNERTTINEIINAVKATPITEKEIILVDDGSLDGTREFISGIDDPMIIVRFHPTNQGKGAAIRTGLMAATGEICLIQDADLEYDPQDYIELIRPIIDGWADVVYGSRFRGNKATRTLYFWHRVGNELLTLISNLLTDLTLTDMETCYKAFRRESLRTITLRENRFGFEPEITAKFARMKLRIYEVGISYHGRTYAEGKKIGWRDGIDALRCILRYNLFPYQ